MLRLHMIQLAKFTGVLLFVGGAVAAFVAAEPAARRTAVHRIGSIGLLLTWASGWLLARSLGWSPGEPWLIGAFATTLAIHLVLTWSVARVERRTIGAGVVVASLVVATLALMIWKPTWAVGA